MSGGPTLSEVRAALVSRSTPRSDSPIHIRAFIAWMGDSNPVSDEWVNEAVATGASRTAAHVAALGFMSHIARWPVPNTVTLADGIGWLRSRTYFVPGRPRTFERDGVAVLGVAFAIRSLHAAADPAAQWLDGLISQSLLSLDRGGWEWSLFVAARVVLESTENSDLVSAILPELRVALCSRGVLASYGDAGETAWQTIIGLRDLPEGLPRAAIHMVAFDRLAKDALPARLARIEVEDVCRVLKGVQSSLRRWPWSEKGRTQKSLPARWDIENEYHVQDMLWVILAPLFPDLDDEEYLESIGHKHPKADLAIPSLQLIIEVKFVRPRESFANVIGQISEDTGLYLAKGSRWHSIISFVWDDSQRTEEHQELRQGLMKLPGIVEAIVIPRPSKMVRSESPDLTAK